MRINLVLSVFNEAQQIQGILNQISAELKKHPAFSYQLYIMNNGSTDDTVCKIAEYMGENVFPCELSLIENEKSIGPADSHQRLFEISLSDPSDYVIKLDLDLDTSITEVLTKFLAHLSNKNNHGQILTGLKTELSSNETRKFSNFRQTVIANEIRATCTSNYFFQDGVGPQAFPTLALRKLIQSPAVLKHGGRRGWDILLPLQAKKMGHQLTTIPLSKGQPLASWQGKPGTTNENEVLQVVFRRIAASN